MKDLKALALQQEKLATKARNINKEAEQKAKERKKRTRLLIQIGAEVSSIWNIKDEKELSILRDYLLSEKQSFENFRYMKEGM